MDKQAGPVSAMWRLAVDYLRDCRRRMDLADEMAALHPCESERLLHDAGLSKADFSRAMRTPFVSRNPLSSAMRALGLDPEAFSARHGAWSRDMDRTCMACPARGRCRRDLATSDFARRYRLYCPNAADLAELAARAARPSS